jgi:DNA-binding transcriptional LysR family regulator
MNLRQLSAFVAIYEEGSFNRAAQRLNATQSGLSMQIKLLEERLGVSLFDRSAQGVRATLAGSRLYGRAVDVLRDLDRAETELRTLGQTITGPLRVGLMPTFTRGMLAPVLSGYLRDHPDVTLSVVEAYSADLVDRVRDGRIDFAVVPRQAERDGLRARPLGTDREILVRRPGGDLPHLAPVRLADLGPLRLVLPAPGNARRDRLDAHFAAEGLPVAAILDMDAMIATLDFVAASDWATILPETICSNDLDGRLRWLHPILPALTVSYVVIEPARKALSPAGVAFLERLETVYAASQSAWADRMAEAGA